ncbi:hypothetical protein PGN35_013475 [Nodosilinea sp. PGN35]|uniref:hypothetical protein n=1 Tax=Nodosilinea sp. PGN35 TaxID=3020489 RepID=UPI0023B25527|nr:hypothetical protein [Nodosilinea sp. TSF1-S3]MDF0366167.1 hypothetical protein [Nodosilinea sp. TSF1-S3]
MTRSRLRAMPPSAGVGAIVGAVLGATLGALICLALVRGLNRPAYVELSGLVMVDSASYPDSRMNNRLVLVESQIEESVYITSRAIDINDLFGLAGNSVRLRGEFRRLNLTTGESILEMEIKDALKTSTPG